MNHQQPAANLHFDRFDAKYESITVFVIIKPNEKKFSLTIIFVSLCSPLNTHPLLYLRGISEYHGVIYQKIFPD